LTCHAVGLRSIFITFVFFVNFVVEVMLR